MLVFSAIVPHPPLLIEKIAKGSEQKLSGTQKGMEDLTKKFIASKPETLLIISSDHKLHHDAFSIILNDEYKTSFADFGDFETSLLFSPDLELIEKIRHSATDAGFKLTLSHKENLDYVFGIPLHLLNSSLKIKIIPLMHSYSNLKEHYELGKIINKIISLTNRRIAVIASGNLSHRSNEESPAGYSPKGKEFNQKIIEIIETKNHFSLLAMDEKLMLEAQESISSSMAMLFGILDKQNYKPQIFSFEDYTGIGYMVANLKLL